LNLNIMSDLIGVLKQLMDILLNERQDYDKQHIKYLPTTI